MSILETDHTNSIPSFVTGPSSTGFVEKKRLPTWASNLVGNQVALLNEKPEKEWTQVSDPSSEFESPIVGLSGTAFINTDEEPDGISRKDVPVLHPFGFDWECYIAPDARYEILLAPSNQGQGRIEDGKNTIFDGDDGNYMAMVQKARQRLGDSVQVPGVIGVEIDSDLIPAGFRALDGDRVAVFGRWIVDAGHDDFHTEIHPPLLLAAARPVNDDETFSTLIARPYLVSQDFGDGALRQHLIEEIKRIAEIIGLIPPPFDTIPIGTEQLNARPTITPLPFEGIILVKYFLKPPTIRQSNKDRLMVRFNITVRDGVAIQIFNAGSDSIGVLIAMNDVSFTPSDLPPKNIVNLTLDEIEKLDEGLGSKIKMILNGVELIPLLPPGLPIDLVFKIKAALVAEVLKKGILTDRYNAPKVPEMNSLVELAIDDLPGNTPVAVNTNPDQPFPVIGTINVGWKRAVSTDHFYTTSVSERDIAIAEFSYEDEGIACHVLPSAQPGSIPLFRLFKPEPADHFYTVSQRERDQMIQEFGYIDEDIACHVFLHVFDTPPPLGVAPLFRCFHPEKGDHFYTTSSDERDRAIAEFGYKDEGITCDVFSSPAERTIPLFRLVKVEVPT